MHIKRGDIITANMPENDDFALTGIRPIIVLSDISPNNFYPFIFAIPISSNTEKYVKMKIHSKLVITAPISNEEKDIVLNCDMLFRIDTKDLIKKVGSVNENVLLDISRITSELYGLKLNTNEENIISTPSITIDSTKDFMDVLLNINEMAKSYKKDNSAKNKIIDYLIGGVIGAILGYAITFV